MACVRVCARARGRHGPGRYRFEMLEPAKTRWDSSSKLHEGSLDNEWMNTGNVKITAEGMCFSSELDSKITSFCMVKYYDNAGLEITIVFRQILKEKQSRYILKN